MNMRHWTVHLTYMNPGQKYRQDAKLGVLAETLEEAIADARVRGVPDDAEEVAVWSANHQGILDLIVDGP